VHGKSPFTNCNKTSSRVTSSNSLRTTVFFYCDIYQMKWKNGKPLGVNFTNVLHAQIPKVQKRLIAWLYFFALMGSVCVKADCKMLVKSLQYEMKKMGKSLDREKVVTILWKGKGRFHQHSTYSFYARRSQKRKKILTSWLSSYAFGIYEPKSCT